MTTLNIHHENASLHFEELWQSFLSVKNTRIVAKDSKDVETFKMSTILLSMCSHVIRLATSDIFESRDFDFDEEVVVILPDFSLKSISNLLNYIQGKMVVFESLNDKEEFERLLEVLSFGIRKVEEKEFLGEFKQEPMDPTEMDLRMMGESKEDLMDDMEMEDNQDSDDEDYKPNLKLKAKITTRKKRGPKKKVTKNGKVKPKEPKVKVEKKEKVNRGDYRVAWYRHGNPMIKDETKGILKCEGCDVNVSKLEESVKHVENLAEGWNHKFNFESGKMFRNDRFKCPICFEYKFERKTHARNHVLYHIQEIHNNVKVCGLCPRNTEYPDVHRYLHHLKRHQDMHKLLRLKECPICKKSFKAFSYTNHVRYCQRRAKNEYLLCQFCPHKTLRAENLKQHLANVHQSERMYPCDQCDKKFYFKSQLSKHVLHVHENVKVICPECGGEFKDEKILWSHRANVHSNMHQYKCGLCEAKFKTRQAIRKHVQIHSSTYLYKCSICNEQFKMNVPARRHRILVHNSKGEVLNIDRDALENLYNKLIVRIEPEEDEYGPNRPRTRNPQPFI